MSEFKFKHGEKVVLEDGCEGQIVGLIAYSEEPVDEGASFEPRYVVRYASKEASVAEKNFKEDALERPEEDDAQPAEDPAAEE